MSSEAKNTRDIIKHVNQRDNVRIFRNNVGVGYCGTLIKRSGDTITLKNARPVRFGLHVGSGDWIGVHRVKITPDMVGKEIGQFVSIEIKSGKGKESDEQKNWKRFIKWMGGIAETVRSVEDVGKVL
jgi:hypothetical protein